MTRAKSGRRYWSPESEHDYTQGRIERAEARNRRILCAFAKWLSSCRGLKPGTVGVRLHSASTFVDAITSGGRCSSARAFRSITAVEIEDFFVGYAKEHGYAAVRSMQAAMRLFVRFAHERGWLERSLLGAVPSLRSYRLSHIPRAVSDEDLSKLFESTWERGQCVGRDRAIVYLLATYGVRRAQLSALKLPDIDWHERTIRFAAHKAGKGVRHGLTDACGSVLGDYLYKERPLSESEFVFLRARRPYVRLSPAAITAMVCEQMERLGLPAYSPHAFRHAFARRLLRAGQSVKTIADVLGHRSLDAVSIYAKVDHARLMEAAVGWPEVAS